MPDGQAPTAKRRKTRNRQTLACTSCRHKKLRCDRQQPCNGCIRSKDKSNVCTYVTTDAQAPNPAPAEAGAPPEARPSLTPPSTTESRNGNNSHRSDLATVTVTDKLQAREAASTRKGERDRTWYSSNIGELLVATPSNQCPPTDQPQHNTSTTTTVPELGSNESGHAGFTHLLEDIRNPINAVMIKTRYLSPSSWLYSVILVPQVIAWFEKEKEEQSVCSKTIQICKALSKKVRVQQKLPWIHGEYGRSLPLRAIADALVGNYLRTFEKVNRILHVPSFEREYELLWTDYASVSMSFVIQVQLCCALGALLIDESFSMRPQAMQWIEEAGVWLDSSSKPRLTLDTVQIMCLYQLARDSTQGTYGDRIWIQSGTLIRAAMSIGLHRDPSKLPPTSFMHSELRRRLWATVLELALGSCLDPGAAPLLSPDDFDCRLPSNLDDAQLNEDSEGIPKNLNQYTDTSLQVLMGRTLGIRLKIAKCCSDLRPDGYDETLRLNTEYVTACRDLSKALRSLHGHISPFQTQYCELVMTRYVFTLHIPYMVISAQSPAFMLSRKACVDAALDIAHAGLPLTERKEALHETLQTLRMNQPQDKDFSRLCNCASGMYRSVLFQAAMILASELTKMADEGQSSFRWLRATSADASSPLGNVRALEMLTLLRAAKSWTKSRMWAGQEVNRDHLCISVALASCESLLKNASAKEAMDRSGKTACMEVKEILEEMTGASGDLEYLETHFSSEEDDLPMFDPAWLSRMGGFTTDFFSL